MRQDLGTLGAGDVGLQEGREEQQGLQRLAQVVAGRRQEAGFGPVGPVGFLFGGPQRLLHGLALGDVVEGRDRKGDVTVRSPHWCGADREGRDAAVAPAVDHLLLVDDLSVERGADQRIILGPVGRSVGMKGTVAGVLAVMRDLLYFVVEQPDRLPVVDQVPPRRRLGDDQAGRQPFEHGGLLGFERVAQSFPLVLGPALLGAVAQDLQEALDGAVAQRHQGADRPEAAAVLKSSPPNVYGL